MSNTGGKLNVFLCYRQVDGKETASWLYKILDGLSITGEGRDQGDAETLDVYFDQTAPAVSNWHEVHQPALMRARAMIFICSPGAAVRRGKDDWVHQELSWWIKNRRAAPILVDPTGQGDRWVPEPVRKRWPDAQRVEVRVAEWERLTESERGQRVQRVTAQIVRGIRLSESKVVDDILRAKRKEILRLRVLVCLLIGAVAWAAWSAYSARALNREMLPYSDSQQLEDLRRRADNTLWPADDSNVPQMEEWIKQARQLASRTELHKSALNDLRQYAEKQGSPPNTFWTFRDIRQQWDQDVLATLVQGLGVLTGPEDSVGTIKEMEARLNLARTIRRKSLEEYAGAWQAAISAIRNSEIYHGLEIKPQIGLVPIGPDPDSKLWEFSDLQTGEIARRGQDGKLVLNENSGLVLVLLPGGKFWMGSQKESKQQPNYDPNARNDESPVHQVELSPFFISKYEMTQGQWLSLTKENPSLYHPGVQSEGDGFSLLHPVEQISWQDCVRVLPHIRMQLPTEAQWEYSARAGTSDPWWTGKDFKSLEGAVNLADKTAAMAGKVWIPIKDWPELIDGSIVHAPVGSYRPNQFGLHDVYGNVWEWCKEIKGSFTAPTKKGDGERMVSEREEDFLRVRRGSACTYGPMEARSAYRTSAHSNYKTPTTGVRPVKQLD